MGSPGTYPTLNARSSGAASPIRVRSEALSRRAAARTRCSGLTAPGGGVQMLAVCRDELGLADAEQLAFAPDGGAWADVAATAPDGRRLAFVHIHPDDQLQGPDADVAAPAPGLPRGLVGRMYGRMRILANNGLRARAWAARAAPAGAAGRHCLASAPVRG